MNKILKFRKRAIYLKSNNSRDERACNKGNSILGINFFIRVDKSKRSPHLNFEQSEITYKFHNFFGSIFKFMLSIKS